MLKKEELIRYNRHIILSDFGIEKQELLKAAKVLVIGAGGLGCPILQYLVAAGVGKITILDGDYIDISNLQRQVLYSVEDVGYPKAIIAAQKLQKQNQFINIIGIQENLNTSNALKYISQHDLVIDGCDNFATRYLVNDACVLSNKPFIYGSIFKFEGQVAVFNYKNGATYRCVFPEPPLPNEVPSCSDVGVIGVLPGIIGVLQATEAIKLICKIGNTLDNKILIYDALTNHQTILELSKNESIKIDKLEEDYNVFCGVLPPKNILESNEISAIDLQKFIDNPDLQIIDVREDWEYEICRIPNSILIPLKTLPYQLHKIDTDKTKVFVCHHGIRSKNAIEYLELNGFNNLLNLTGGIHEWALSVDKSMNKY
ncbi:MAG: molybdopterin-synthase adenylyltransferase MoeB [Cytophagales bacterium]